MAVALYSSRIILAALGDVDYGVYSVVGGIVVMLAFLNNSLIATTQRFLNFEMGSGNRALLPSVFSTAVISHYIIALAVVVIAETLGLWFVKTQLVIPPERMNAALTVFHCSVATMAVNIIASPYNAAIIANEKMKVYAGFSILEALLTLLLAYLLTILPYDKLSAYGILVLSAGIIIRFAYIIYCRRKFAECRFKFTFQKELFRRMFSFTGWMFAGSFTNMLSTQGQNILINIFFGPVLNSARAIAMRVHSVIQSLVESVVMAVRPQVVKSYSAGENDYMRRLVFSSSKLSFYIVLLISLPLLFNTELILGWWLVEIPRYAVLFTKLLLIDVLVTSMHNSIGIVSQSSGRIKFYQITISAGFILIFLLTWLCFKAGQPAYYAFIISIAVNFAGIFARLWEIGKSANFDSRNYIRKVLLPTTVVCALSFLIAYGTIWLIGESTVGKRLLSAVIYTLMTLFLIIAAGTDREEKKLLRNFLPVSKADKSI